jgi:transposase InsO family protein
VEQPRNHSLTTEAFVSHANAQLTPAGRLRLAQLVVDKGWPLRRAAERWNCSVTTARRWADRYRAQGRTGMADRSSRPATSPRRTATRVERRVIGLRISRRWGPARIAYRLGLNPATVHKILRRYGCPLLAWTDPATGVRIKWARKKANSYVHEAPGDLVHVDIKKLGRIPDGGGHKVLGRARGPKDRARRGMGYWYIHNAVDDRTRLAYSELLTDERKETAAEFWQRANAYFKSVGITVQRVLTDNGACCRSRDFAAALAEDKITHKRTRPYRPQTNGKVERFNRTTLEEWAYARPYSSESAREACFVDWLHTYNHHRGHTSLGGLSPADLVPNLRGQNN